MSSADARLPRKIARALLRAGAAPHFDGFRSLLIATQLSIEDSSISLPDIYAQIAAMNEVDANTVEDDIRVSVERAWMTGALTMFCADTGLSVEHCPSSSEFISLIVSAVQMMTD